MSTKHNGDLRVHIERELFLQHNKSFPFHDGGTIVWTSWCSSNSWWICKTQGWKSSCIYIGFFRYFRHSSRQSKNILNSNFPLKLFYLYLQPRPTILYRSGLKQLLAHAKVYKSFWNLKSVLLELSLSMKCLKSLE